MSGLLRLHARLRHRWFLELTMNELEISLALLIAARDAMHRALELTRTNQVRCVKGSRALTCANANAPILHGMLGDLDIMGRTMHDVLARHNRMNGV